MPMAVGGFQCTTSRRSISLAHHRRNWRTLLFPNKPQTHRQAALKHPGLQPNRRSPARAENQCMSTTTCGKMARTCMLIHALPRAAEAAEDVRANRATSATAPCRSLAPHGPNATIAADRRAGSLTVWSRLARAFAASWMAACAFAVEKRIGWGARS